MSDAWDEALSSRPSLRSPSPKQWKTYVQKLERAGSDMQRELAAAREEKNGVYLERNQLVAHLASLYPSSLERHPDNEEWEDDWRWIVFIDGPTGQLSWHLHDSHLCEFQHVSRMQGRAWDGTTTPQKYARLRAARGDT